MGGFELVNPGAALIDHAFAVADGDIGVLHAHRFDQCGAGERGSTRAVDHHLDIAQFTPGNVAGVEQASGGDDRGAVLIIVHHRNFHPLAQGLLDDEAFGRLDVFKVDAAECRLHQRDGFDEFVRVFGVQFNVDRIDVGKAFEQRRLAFHHRLRCQRAQIAHAKNCCAVGDHRDEVALGSVIIGGGGIVIDRLDRNGDARRIGEAEVALSCHRLGGDNLNLTGPNGLVIEQRLALSELDVAFFAGGSFLRHAQHLPVASWPLTIRRASR